jgi:hypothetical protein
MATRKARARLTLPVEDLVKMRDNGLTLSQIADTVYEQTGEQLSPQAVSYHLTRAGAGVERPRYEDLVPWRVAMRHQKHWLLRMLRLEGRRRDGQELADADLDRVKTFLEEMAADDCVVIYNQDWPEGFFTMPRHMAAELGMTVKDLVAVLPEQQEVA